MVYDLEETIDSLTEKLGGIFRKTSISFESDGYKDELGIYKGSAYIPFTLHQDNPKNYSAGIEEFLQDHGEYGVRLVGTAYGLDDLVATLRRADKMKDGVLVFKEPGYLSFSYIDELLHQLITTIQNAFAYVGLEPDEAPDLPGYFRNWFCYELDEDSRESRAFILDEAVINAAYYGNKRYSRRHPEILTIDITYGAHGILYVITDKGDGFEVQEMVDTHNKPGYTNFQPEGVKRTVGGNIGDGTRKTHLTQQVIASFQKMDEGFATLIHMPFNNEEPTPNT